MKEGVNTYLEIHMCEPGNMSWLDGRLGDSEDVAWVDVCLELFDRDELRAAQFGNTVWGWHASNTPHCPSLRTSPLTPIDECL